MALRTFVKVSQINNLSDARFCAGMGVALLGFNLEPGTIHYVAPEKFRELSEWVAGVSFAAEFEEATPETIKRLLPEYPVDYIQTAKAAYLPELAQLEVPLILKVEVTAATTPDTLEQLFAENKELTQFFLLEAMEATPLPAVLTQAILSLSNSYAIVAGFGFDEKSVTKLLEAHPLKGIALKGGQEIRAGYKDFDELADVLEALEVDEAF